MAVYPGAIPPGPPGVVIQPICFTRRAAELVRTALTVGTGLLGAVVGAGIGAALAVMLTEGVATTIFAIIGAVVGGEPAHARRACWASVSGSCISGCRPRRRYRSGSFPSMRRRDPAL